jgi:hypothetical protein
LVLGLFRFRDKSGVMTVFVGFVLTLGLFWVQRNNKIIDIPLN